MFAPPSLVRAHTTPPPPPLTAAVLAASAPAKTFDRDAFRPKGAKGGACDVTVYIDTKGDVYAADLAQCREDLHLFVKSAVLAWKYTPVLVDGVAQPAKFVANVAVR